MWTTSSGSRTEQELTAPGFLPLSAPRAGITGFQSLSPALKITHAGTGGGVQGTSTNLNPKNINNRIQRSRRVWAVGFPVFDSGGGGVLILTSIPVPCLTHWGGTVNSHHILSAEVVTETQPHVKGSIQRLHLLMEEYKRISGHILKRTPLATEWLML